MSRDMCESNKAADGVHVMVAFNNSNTMDFCTLDWGAFDHCMKKV